MERKTLAEKMAEQLREAVLAGVWADGDALPTEPELAERFGVSRAVVRDATRIVTAWGLVEPRQGKGVFVNGDPRRGFSDALMLALRRTGGTALDVNQVDNTLMPEAAALAAARCEEIDFEELHSLVSDYEKALVGQHESRPETVGFSSPTRDAFLKLMEAFYEASGNRLLAFLGPAITRIRSPLHFDDAPGVHPVAESRRETDLLRTMIDIVASGDADAARQFFSDKLAPHEKIIPTLAGTPVGEVPMIPLTFRDLEKKG